MNKKIKAKWIKALRSGKYKQARGMLRNSKGAMCCLGVLATIQGCDLVKWHEETGESFRTNYVPYGKDAGLSALQRELLASLNDGGDYYNEADDYQKLKRHSFRQIANYIQKNL